MRAQDRLHSPTKLEDVKLDIKEAKQEGYRAMTLTVRYSEYETIKEELEKMGILVVVRETYGGIRLCLSWEK